MKYEIGMWRGYVVVIASKTGLVIRDDDNQRAGSMKLGTSTLVQFGLSGKPRHMTKYSRGT